MGVMIVNIRSNVRYILMVIFSSIGMDFEGIYRKSGGMSQMKAIIMAFEQGEDLDLNSPVEFNDIGAVTSVLRQFFRELPDPLFTTGLYNKFLEAAGMYH